MFMLRNEQEKKIYIYIHVIETTVGKVFKQEGISGRLNNISVSDNCHSLSHS